MIISILLQPLKTSLGRLTYDQAALFNEQMKKHFNTPDNAFKPYFDHQDIDAKLGHVNLLRDNLHLLSFDSNKTRDLIVNKLHDLKHAFDLMSIEIEDYYSNKNGKYFPRQPIYFAAI